MAYKVADPNQKLLAPGPVPNGLKATDDALWYIDQSNDHIFKLDWSTGRAMHEAPTESEHSGGITLDDDSRKHTLVR